MNYKEATEKVDNIIKEYLEEKKSNIDNRILSGMWYALDGGKRLRAIITLAIIEKLQCNNWEEYKKVCLIPEFIHTASLIIDDLPAFDNAKERRNKKCIHLTHGEGLAYLLSFSLVTESILILHENLQYLKQNYTHENAYKKCENQLLNLVTNISSRKALEGQLLSTFHTSGVCNLRDMKDDKPSLLTIPEIRDILCKKTSSFFEIAIVIGWISGNGDIDKLPELKKMSELLGICYQVYDDFIDYEQDVNISGHFSHNYVYHCGIEESYSHYEQYSNELKEIINNLDLNCPIFDYILKFMNDGIIKAKNKL